MFEKEIPGRKKFQEKEKERNALSISKGVSFITFFPSLEYKTISLYPVHPRKYWDQNIYITLI